MMTNTELHAIRVRLAGEASITVAELRQVALNLLDEVARDRIREQLLRTDYVELLEAARAAVSAAHHHACDPVTFMEDELARKGLLPPPEMTPVQALADAGILRRLLDTA
jgi:hypothetical protein